MKKLAIIFILLSFLAACARQEVFDENQLEILKCDYVSESLLYENIARIKQNEIITSTVTVYSDTEAERKEVEETLQALFNTDFTYAEQGDLKLLSAIINTESMSDEMKTHLLLDEVLSQPEHSLQVFIDSIENHPNKDVSVTCKII